MKSKWGAAAVAVLVCVLAAPHVAMAHPEVDAARGAYMEGDFVGALSHLEAAERSPSATEADRVSIHWYRAASCHALGRAQDAAVAMDALLLLRPMFVPSRAEAPPDLRAALAERQRLYQEAHGVGLGDLELWGTGIRVPLLGHVESVGRVVAFVRVAPDVDYTPVTLQVTGTLADGDLPITLWQRAARTGNMEVVLEAHNARGALAARAGDALKPLSLVVTPDVAQEALAQLQPDTLIHDPAPVGALPAVTTENSPPRAARPPGTSSRYRFGFPPWVFVMLTTGVMATCAGFSFGGCSLFGLLSVLFAVLIQGNNPLLVLSALMGGLSCGIGTLFCCASLPLSGCTGVLWVADFFYVNPHERAVKAPVTSENDEL